MNSETKFPTTELMKAAYYNNHKQDAYRGYLGASGLGENCFRKMWLNFRSMSPAKFPAEVLFRFDDGHYSEKITAQRLKLVDSVRLITEHTDHKQFSQYRFNGHLGGHIDGYIGGIVQYPTEWLIWEHKCVEQKEFVKLHNKITMKNSKNPLQEWNERYYCQAQVYMDLFDFDKHFLTVAIAGSRKYIEAITKRDDEYIRETYKIAKNIITSDDPGPIPANAEKYPCKYCHHKELCHSHKLPFPSCRTCIYGSASLNNNSKDNWRCGKHNKNLSVDDQIRGCDSHLYNPKLLQHWAIQYDCRRESISYERRDNFERFTNGNGAEMVSSKALYEWSKT